MQSRSTSTTNLQYIKFLNITTIDSWLSTFILLIHFSLDGLALVQPGKSLATGHSLSLSLSSSRSAQASAQAHSRSTLLFRFANYLLNIDHNSERMFKRWSNLDLILVRLDGIFIFSQSHDNSNSTDKQHVTVTSRIVYESAAVTYPLGSVQGSLLQLKQTMQ